jgi:hypothetical protein
VTIPFAVKMRKATATGSTQKSSQTTIMIGDTKEDGTYKEYTKKDLSGNMFFTWGTSWDSLNGGVFFGHWQDTALVDSRTMNNVFVFKGTQSGDPEAFDITIKALSGASGAASISVTVGDETASAEFSSPSGSSYEDYRSESYRNQTSTATVTGTATTGGANATVGVTGTPIGNVTGTATGTAVTTAATTSAPTTTTTKAGMPMATVALAGIALAGVLASRRR